MAKETQVVLRVRGAEARVLHVLLVLLLVLLLLLQLRLLVDRL